MDSETKGRPVVRLADLDGPDGVAVSGLVRAYLAQTEREKVDHLGAPRPADEHELPERYREEAERPAHAYRNAVVHIAELGASPVGVVVAAQASDSREIKRFWVDPGARGHRAGSALMDAALGQADLPTRLTVWDWRRDAIHLYERRGFVRVASWDDRPRLVCMERPPSLPRIERVP